MFSDGTGTLPPARPRPCPPKIHLFWFAPPVLSNRLAKMFSLLKLVVCSYHVAHGTMRFAPAKSIAGASPSWAWSKFSDPVNGLPFERPPTVPLPCVFQ